MIYYARHIYPRFFFFGSSTANSLVISSGLLRNRRYNTTEITLRISHMKNPDMSRFGSNDREALPKSLSWLTRNLQSIPVC